MRKILTTLMLGCLVLAGCESLRFGPSEDQKQNAWLHNRTTAAAAQSARAEDASEKLQALTQLSELQSRAFTSYYGLPRELPPAQSAEEILAESNFQLAERASAQSAERPDAFVLADSIFELAIGICALMGGVYGTRAVGFLKDARAKSKALKEIIEGNELFKSSNSESTEAFKAAHKDQSPSTRQIVAEVKSS